MRIQEFSRRRILEDWVNGYLNYTEQSEPAYLYRKGCSLSIIASVLQRKCWIPFRRSTLYPNLYIILVGGTGVRKGTAFAQAQKFINIPEIGVRLAVDSTSKVQLIKDFIGATETTLMPSGEQYLHSSLTIHAPELTVFLGYQNLDFLTALIDWYDSNKNPWVYRTGNAGNNEIVGVWANMLGASTPDLLRAALPLVSIGGGLIGRMLLLFSPKREKKIYNDPTKAEDELEAHLREDLIEIAKMRGSFRFSEGFIDAAMDFYDKFDEEECCKDHRFEGYFNRKIATLYKLSMIFSASRSNHMVVTQEDFTRSVQFLEEVESVMYWSLQGIGRNNLADITLRVMTEIGRTNGSAIGPLMTKFRDDLSRHELDIVLQTLTSIGFCTHFVNTGKIEITPKGGSEHGMFNGQIKHDTRNETFGRMFHSENQDGGGKILGTKNLLE